jgi:hypothetical protein
MGSGSSDPNRDPAGIVIIGLLDSVTEPEP